MTEAREIGILEQAGAKRAMDLDRRREDGRK